MLPRLRTAFHTVTVLETLTFMKTMNRQRIELRGDGRAGAARRRRAAHQSMRCSRSIRPVFGA
jgi:hypothetical protein